MPLSFTAAVRDCAQAAADLAGSPPVRACRGEESACAGTTVGGLAHHSAGQGGTRAPSSVSAF